MALIKCPECGREKVSDKAICCPSCGYTIAGYGDRIIVEHDSLVKNSNNLKKYVAIGIGLFLAVIFFLFFSISRCSVSGCNNKQSSGSSMCNYHKNLYREKASYDYNYKPADTRNISDLRFTVDEVTTDSACTYAMVTVKNTGRDSFSFVEVKASFTDGSGNVVGIGNSYAAGKEGIGPGESNTFRVSTSRNVSIMRCSISVIDYD